MPVEWVDVKTGEVFDECREGAVEILKEPVAVVDHEHSDEDGWLPDHYLRRCVELDARDNALRDQFSVRLRSLQAERARLDWLYRARVERRVLIDLDEQKGDRATIDYPHGRLGFRVPRRIDVVDGAAALMWALCHCPAAVKTTVGESLLKSELPTDVDVPGIRRPTTPELTVRLPKAKA